MRNQHIASVTLYAPVAILDSAYRGGHYSKITFIVRPLHITLHFLHLCTLKIGLKLHVCVPKILGLAMPVHMSTFHQDFPQLIFTRGGRGPPLKSPMLCPTHLKNTTVSYNYIINDSRNIMCILYNISEIYSYRIKCIM